MATSLEIGRPTSQDVAIGTAEPLNVAILVPSTKVDSDLSGATVVTFYMRLEGASTNLIDGVTSGVTLAQANPGQLEYDWTAHPTSGIAKGIYHAWFFYTLGGVAKPVTAVTLWFKHPWEIITGGK